VATMMAKAKAELLSSSENPAINDKRKLQHTSSEVFPNTSTEMYFSGMKSLLITPLSSAIWMPAASFSPSSSSLFPTFYFLLKRDETKMWR
jgi:hypothetical protein